MSLDEAYLRTAAALHPQLPSLVGDAAPELQQQLGQLLHRAEMGESAAAISHEIRRLFRDYPTAKEWLKANFHEYEFADLGTLIPKSFNPLAGNSPTTEAAEYRCPEPGCNYTEFREDEQIPRCEEHNRECIPVEDN
ncbi:MAG: hypothetical protein F6J87_13875 [Spirulina sp. SIO3F2]|nr:hypothetical protein [Spirulina sp. SIO3F2]